MIHLRGVVLVGALLWGACSGGGDDDGAGGGARTVEPTTTSQEDTSTTSTTEASKDVALNQVVVQLGDLPTGWSASPPEDDESDDSFCEGQDPFNEIDPQEEAESSFQQSEFGPFVASGASLYADDDEATGVIDLLTTMANSCQSFTQTEDDGTETEYTITPLSFPNLGDDTFAFRMSGSTPFGPINLDIAAVRDGPIVVSLVNGGLGAADSELTESLTSTMIDRL